VYYANIHGRPTVNGMSGWGPYFLNSVMSENWQKPPGEYPYGPVGVEALRALHIAGLRYAIMHRAWLSEKDQQLYLAGLEQLGATRVGTYQTDDLYELPSEPTSRPPRAGDLLTELRKIEWRDRAARDVFLSVRFVNKTGENLYEPLVEHFSVKATAAGETIGRGDGYLAPPLFAAHGSLDATCRMQLVRKPRPDWVDITLTDDDGNVWGTAQAKLPN
jgi:hypothetical protein